MARPHPSSARRSALTHRVMSATGGDAGSGGSALSVRRILAAGIAARLPQPSREPEQREPDRPSLGEFPGRRRLFFGRQHLLISFELFRLRRFYRTRARATIARRHPSRDERKRLRRARRTLLRVMYFFAVEAQTRVPQLHSSSLAPSGRRRERVIHDLWQLLLQPPGHTLLICQIQLAQLGDLGVAKLCRRGAERSVAADFEVF